MPTYTTCPQNSKTWRTSCSNASSWTDSTITANSTLIKKVHVDELRTSINNERYRRNKEVSNDYTFTDSTITANSTKVRATHFSDLRAAEDSTTGMTCPSDSVGTFTWTDSTITANSTKVRKVHIDELRTNINLLRATCVCNCEFCNYCSDCGYGLGCGCDNSQSTECSFSCGSINSGYPTQNPSSAWCVYDYGSNWSSPNKSTTPCPLYSSYATYGCMCTPYACMC